MLIRLTNHTAASLWVLLILNHGQKATCLDRLRGNIRIRCRNDPPWPMNILDKVLATNGYFERFCFDGIENEKRDRRRVVGTRDLLAGQT